MKLVRPTLLWLPFSLFACGDAGNPGFAEETGDLVLSTGVEAETGEVDDGLDRSPVEHVCEPGDAAGDLFADCVESFVPVDAGFGQDELPGIVLGPPVGGGEFNGSLDVLSLGCGGSITLFFDEPAIVDGPGPDLLVFENPFRVGDITFVEPARVLVSADGVDWRAFHCDPANVMPVGCAGLTPVLSAPGNGVAPNDPSVAGGDAFDLESVGLPVARYVRLIDVGVEHHGGYTWCGGASGGFDLDAVTAVHGD